MSLLWVGWNLHYCRCPNSGFTHNPNEWAILLMALQVRVKASRSAFVTFLQRMVWSTYDALISEHASIVLTSMVLKSMFHDEPCVFSQNPILSNLGTTGLPVPCASQMLHLHPQLPEMFFAPCSIQLPYNRITKASLPRERFNQHLAGRRWAYKVRKHPSGPAQHATTSTKHRLVRIHHGCGHWNYWTVRCWPLNNCWLTVSNFECI